MLVNCFIFLPRGTALEGISAVFLCSITYNPVIQLTSPFSLDLFLSFFVDTILTVPVSVPVLVLPLTQLSINLGTSVQVNEVANRS